MPIEVKALDELIAANVQQVQEELATLMNEANPSIDTRFGVLHDVLFHNEAIYAEKAAEETRRLKRSSSLLAIAEDPDLADDDTVEKTASNHRIVRKAGSQASGTMTIIVSELATVVIPSGDIWEANGIEFQTLATFTGRTSEANVQSTNDRVLTAVGDGTYSFTISVTAVEEGASGAVTKDTAFVPQDSPLNFVQAYAAADFTGGRDEEANADLVGRALAGDAAKTLSASVHMSAALRDRSGFEDIVADSIIGFGDAEMIRDQHSIFPGSVGGRIDWYIRSQNRVQNVGATKTATLVEITESATSIWQFGVGRDELPGFFDIVSIVPKGAADATSFAVTSDVRSLDLTALDNDGFLPDIAETVEGIYSRFQAAVIQFEDTDTNIDGLTVGDTAEYAVTLRGVPLIGDIQDWAAGRPVRNRAGDALIKAPVPCFLRVSFTIELQPGQATPDTETIANELAELVNGYGFTGRLPASALADVVHDNLTGKSHVSAIDMLGDIRRPDGVIRRIRTTEILEVPNEPGNMVTARTVAFFLDPDDVAISVEEADIPEL